MKHVLIPTDFSENANNAVKYALEYFMDIPVVFYLLHVSLKMNKGLEMEIEEHFGNPDERGVIESPAIKFREQIKAWNALKKNPHHEFFAIHKNTSLVEAIRNVVLQKEIDYILMGTKGASNMQIMGIGSNTCEVITKVKCPVLVIPQNAKYSGITNVAFPTDYNCVYKNKVVSTIFETLKLQNADLRILHIKSRQNALSSHQLDNKDFLQDFLKDTKHSFHFLENSHIETEIQNFVEEFHIDIIAMVAKNLNLIQRLLFQPNDKWVSYPSQIPFLVIHE